MVTLSCWRQTNYNRFGHILGCDGNRLFSRSKSQHSEFYLKSQIQNLASLGPLSQRMCT